MRCVLYLSVFVHLLKILLDLHLPCAEWQILLTFTRKCQKLPYNSHSNSPSIFARCKSFDTVVSRSVDVANLGIRDLEMAARCTEVLELLCLIATLGTPE
jgi:hypothetical protein